MHQRDPDHIVGTLLHSVTDLDDAARQQWAEQGRERVERRYAADLARVEELEQEDAGAAAPVG